MLKKNMLVCILSVLFLLNSFSCAEELSDSKKVVSIVYDDSGSMKANNNFCYSKGEKV